MFELLSGFVGALAAVGVAGVGYFQSRRFVAKRLRFVDQAQGPAVPVIAGAVALAVAIPVVAILPIVGAGTAIAFGVSVAAGTHAGKKTFGRSLYP